jgi:tetratricopeptide (TPR) repeat protein
MNLAVLEQMLRDGDLSVDAAKYLIDCRAECEWLDFKLELKLDRDIDVAGFGRDVLAMKNTGGGYIVVGVQDKTWVPTGFANQLNYDAKLLRDKVQRATGLQVDVDIVQHELRYSGEPRWFAVILIRSSKKRRKRRVPSLVRGDFHPRDSYGLRRGEIYFRRGDSTIRLEDSSELEDLLDELEERTDHERLTHSANPFAIDLGTYRLLEQDYNYFVGRQTLRDELLAAITGDPRIWIINVHGPGGVGKSALVTWATYELYYRRQFEAILQLTAKETVLAVEGITRSLSRTLYSLEDLLDQILRLFGEEPSAAIEEKKAQVLEWLAAWSTLLVLDNLETVDDGRILAFVQNLPPDSKAKVVMTSRRKTGGWEFPVTVPELKGEEVREFVSQKIAELGLQLSLDDTLLERIERASGGLPLAIQWALGRYKLCGDLDDALAAVGSKESPLLEFSFRNIWEVLSQDARRVLALLSIFESPPNYQLVSIATDLGSERLDNSLRELEDATLVSHQIHAADGEAAYVCLPITLSFARIQLAALGDLEVVARRRIQKYTQQMELQSWEVGRFVTTFERFGIQSDNEKRGVILCRRGETEVFAGDPELAESLFAQARGLAPTSAYILAMSANFELARGRIGQAMKFVESACARATKRTGGLAYSVKARVCDAQRDKMGRVTALRAAVGYDGADVVLRHQLGVALSRAGYPSEAITEFSWIVDQEGALEYPSETLIMALKTRIINYRRLGLKEEALEDLNRAKQLVAGYPHLKGQAEQIAELE